MPDKKTTQRETQVDKNFEKATEHLDKEEKKALEKQNKAGEQHHEAMASLSEDHKKGTLVALEIHDETAENGKLGKDEDPIENERERSRKIDEAQAKERKDARAEAAKIEGKANDARVESK